MSILPLLYQIYRDQQEKDKKLGSAQADSYALQMDKLNDPAFANERIALGPSAGMTRGQAWGQNRPQMEAELPPDAMLYKDAAVRKMADEREMRTARDQIAQGLPENLRPYATVMGGDPTGAGKLLEIVNPQKKEQDKYKNYPSGYVAWLESNPGATPSPQTYSAWRAEERDTAKAGASSNNITVGSEKKFGEGIGTNAANIVDAEYSKMQGAVAMNDASDRILGAIEQGSVISGPLANESMKVRQFIAGVTGGDTKKIEATREVIRGLAEMTLESRAYLKGQGQITEMEQKVAAKAMSGDIEDVTVPELKIIATLNKRAAKLKAESFSKKLDYLRAKDPDMAKMYDVPGIGGLMADTPKPGGPPRAPRQGMKWQRNTKTGEYREVPAGGL